MKTQIKISVFLIIAYFLLVIVPLGVKAQPVGKDQNEPDKGSPSREPRESQRRLSFIKQADFYLRDERFVTGKLIEEDKNKVIVEQLEGSELIVMTYSKREVDTRTLKINNIPEVRYYRQLGDYFASRTWDFRDDADDFIQAIRSYEKAKRAAVSAQRKESEIEQLQAKIDELEADRQVWSRQVADRAKLKRMEFEATFDERFKQLEKQIAQSNKMTEIASERLDKFVRQTEQDFQNFAKNLEGIENNISRRLSFLEEKIDENRKSIKDINRHYYHSPRYYYRGRKR